MARTRTFDPEETLNIVMNLFWEKGFLETSYDDIISATKVSRKGLYSVFGDKEALFLCALKNYCDKVVPRIFKTLRQHDVTIIEVIEMLEHFTHLVASGNATRGCLLVNTSATSQMNREEVRALINNHVKTLAAGFSKAFSVAGASKKEAIRLGDYYTGVIQALLHMAQAGTEARVIKNFMKTALKELENL